MKGKLTPESYLIDQEDYPRAVKQGTQRLEDVAQAYVDWGRRAAAAAGRAGGCKQDCTARRHPAIAEDLHLLRSEELLEMVGVPNLEGAAWVDMVV